MKSDDDRPSEEGTVPDLAGDAGEDAVTSTDSDEPDEDATVVLDKESDDADTADEADDTVVLEKESDDVDTAAEADDTVVLDKESDADTVVAKTAKAQSADRHWAASLALAAATAALIAAVVCVGWFGYTGVRAYAFESQREAVRNGAVDGAEQAILNTMTIDPAHMDAWQKRIKSSLTGDALKQATDESAQGLIQQVESAQGSAKSIRVKIISSAATEVNVDDETAKVLVLSEATASSAPDQPSGQSYLLTMVKDDGAWKASVVVPLTGIPYDADSATPVGTDGDSGEQGSGN